MITKKQLQKIIPTNHKIDDWYQPIITILPKYNINSNVRLAAFLSQCAHESNDFTILKENLNYKANTLIKVFPNEFPSLSLAESYVGNPEKIANRLYCDRMGNGCEESGDGFKYHGRGIIQLTGKDEYEGFSEFCKKSLDDIPNYLETPEGSIMSACWYWDIHNLNQLADKKDIKTITKKINGGLIGYDDRNLRFIHALNILETK